MSNLPSLPSLRIADTRRAYRLRENKFTTWLREASLVERSSFFPVRDDISEELSKALWN
jgi:hypothetical protein